MTRRRPHVTVVGLGPAGADLLPHATAALLRDAGDRAFLRTDRHPAAASCGGRRRAFDDLYESAATFDEVYAGIVDALVDAAREAAPEDVVYAVPGSPLVAERSVELLRADDRLDVTVLPAPSFLDLAWAALALDPVAAGVHLVDAEAFGHLGAGEAGPFLVAQCWSRHLLSEVKLAGPDDARPPEARPVILHHLGLDDEVVAEVDWWELDRTVEPDHLTSLYVPARPVAAAAPAGAEVEKLMTLMDTLRLECPWDRAQTHASLMPHLVEESYEVLDAIAALDASSAAASGAYDHLEEELGDLLFQIVFHARLADEAGRFDLADVARGVHDKLVHRHPHVFGDRDAPSADQVVANWEAIKKDEKGRSSVTEGIPAGLPALMLATKLARKARGIGVEPLDQSDDTIADGLALLQARAERAAAGPDDRRTDDRRSDDRRSDDPRSDDPTTDENDAAAGAVGELLFAVAVLAQHLGVDAEQALRSRALGLRDDIRVAEGVPKDEVGNR